MTKTCKKTIIVFLCLIMCFSIIGIDVISENIFSNLFAIKSYAASVSDLTYTIKNGKVTITGCSRSANGEFVIPATIDGCSVTSLGNGAFEDCYKLTKITIPNSVISIGDEAFSYCTKLTSVTIPNSVTTIGQRAFYGCIVLTSLTIPKSITSIGNEVFYGCEELTSITIPNSVTSIGNNAFTGCIKLASIKIPDSVTSIGDEAFSYCFGLTNVTIPNSITNISYRTFYTCEGLKSVTIPNSVRTIGDSVFEDCSRLTSVTIGNSVTSIGMQAFWSCSELTSIVFPSSVKSIGKAAFGGCSKLKSITIPNSVTSMGEVPFYYCAGLEKISVLSGNTVYHSAGNCLIETRSKTLITGCKNSIIPTDGSVTSIGKCAFWHCNDLTSITIPDSIMNIGDGAFQFCGLTSITLPDSVTSISDNAFYNINNINYRGSATGSPWGAKCVNGYVDGDFVYKDFSKTNLAGCNRYIKEERIVISPNVDTIGDFAFCECSSVKKLYIPVNVTRIGSYAFQYTALTDVYYEGNTNDKLRISFGEYNSIIKDATWHYNSKISDMSSNPSNPDNPTNPTQNIPEANIIKGNSADNKKTYDYRTTVTFTAIVPEGGCVQWYVDGKPAGTDNTLTVKDMKTDYTVKVVVTDKNGNKTMDEEQVTIKHGFFDILIWFFVHLFNPGAYVIKQ